jgi:hypothetical protein
MCVFGQELGMPVWLGQELVTPTTLRFLISLFLR